MTSAKLRSWAGWASTSAIIMALVLTSSMVSLAAQGKVVGELTVSTGSAETAVTVNGEVARNGRTLFANSVVATGDGAQAVISIGKGVKIQLAPDSKFLLAPDPVPYLGTLTAGRIIALNSSQGVSIRNSYGEVVKLNTGESIEAGASSAVKQSGSVGGLEPWQLALIIGAAVAVVVLVVVASGGDDSSPVSPIR